MLPGGCTPKVQPCEAMQQRRQKLRRYSSVAATYSILSLLSEPWNGIMPGPLAQPSGNRALQSACKGDWYQRCARMRVIQHPPCYSLSHNIYLLLHTSSSFRFECIADALEVKTLCHDDLSPHHPRHRHRQSQNEMETELVS